MPYKAYQFRQLIATRMEMLYDLDFFPENKYVLNID